jgi:hypothetical protein
MKRILQLCITLLLLGCGLSVAQTAPAGCSLLASDNFTRSNSSTTLGSNWTTQASTWGITSNNAYMPTGPSSTHYGAALYTASTPNNNQCATIIISASWNNAVAYHAGVGVRLANSGNVSGYYMYCSAYSGSNCTTLLLLKTASLGYSTYTTLQTISSLTIASGSSISLLANGTTLQAFVNGAQVGTNTTDSTYTSGYAGVGAYGSGNSNGLFSYFEADNYSTALASPTFSVSTGTYNVTESETITPASGATGCYSLGGGNPLAATAGTCNGTDSLGATEYTYSTAVSITATSTLCAISTETGQSNSSPACVTITLQVGAITASPAAGTFTSVQTVALSVTSTTGATIHYRTDGTAAACTDTSYSTAIAVSVTTTITAIGCETGYSNSAAYSGVFTIQIVSAPTFSPNGGTFNASQSVTISVATPSTGVTISYCTSTSACTPGTTYSTAVSVSATGYLCANGAASGWGTSSTACVQFTIQAVAPSFSPGGGTYSSVQTVTLSTTTSGCGSYIYWSTGHTPPTTSDNNNTSASVTTTETVYAKVIGCPGWSDSNVGSANYTITVSASVHRKVRMY